MFSRLGLTILICLSAAACTSSVPAPKEERTLKIGTGSRIDILTPQVLFYQGRLPKGWVIKGASAQQLFTPKNQTPAIHMAKRDGYIGLFLQNSADDFILARYNRSKLLVTPFLSWQWHVSEHQGPSHPVRMMVGFYGGKADSPGLNIRNLTWRQGNILPPHDRVLSIGFDDLALKRGTLRQHEGYPYYVQRGGFEHTNQWLSEAVDLSALYQRAWPEDNMGKVHVTFIGMGANSSHKPGGMTFSSIWLSR